MAAPATLIPSDPAAFIDMFSKRNDIRNEGASDKMPAGAVGGGVETLPLAGCTAASTPQLVQWNSRLVISVITMRKPATRRRKLHILLLALMRIVRKHSRRKTASIVTCSTSTTHGFRSVVTRRIVTRWRSSRTGGRSPRIGRISTLTGPPGNALSLSAQSERTSRKEVPSYRT
jgi:hypothetical protein